MESAARLIGYFAKMKTQKPDGLRAPDVVEICSVSCCIAKGPENWIERWRHNAMWLYPSEEEAQQSIADSKDAPLFDVFAYRIEPIAFDRSGGTRPQPDDLISNIDQAEGTASPVPADYEFLGYDCVAVGGSEGLFAGFGCSPLSCNGMAGEIPVNRYCLIDDRTNAIETASRFEKDPPEPGPYCVLEVWRQRRTRPTS